MSDRNDFHTIELATDLAVAWLGNQNNRVAAEDVAAFLRTVHRTLTELAGKTSELDAEDAGSAQEFAPAVSVRKSLASKDHIISMIDGKPYRTLRRHLSSHGLTPEEYRARYNLKSDYPMVAPSYSEQRAAMAKKIGLGSKRNAARSESAETPAPAAPKRAARKKAVEA